jgi:hypothetical protein
MFLTLLALKLLISGNSSEFVVISVDGQLQEVPRYFQNVAPSIGRRRN